MIPGSGGGGELSSLHGCYKTAFKKKAIANHLAVHSQVVHRGLHLLQFLFHLADQHVLRLHLLLQVLHLAEANDWGVLPWHQHSTRRGALIWVVLLFWVSGKMAKHGLNNFGKFLIPKTCLGPKITNYKMEKKLVSEDIGSRILIFYESKTIPAEVGVEIATGKSKKKTKQTKKTKKDKKSMHKHNKNVFAFLPPFW